MTARELADKLDDIRRRYEGRLDEARQKQARAAVVLEEARQLAIHADGYRLDLTAPNYEQPVREQAWAEARILYRAFMFGEEG